MVGEGLAGTGGAAADRQWSATDPGPSLLDHPRGAGVEAVPVMSVDCLDAVGLVGRVSIVTGG